VPVIDGRKPYIISDAGGKVLCIICCGILFIRVAKTRAGVKFRYVPVLEETQLKLVL